MEAAFLLAALPEPVVLLRQRLEPYSLGHHLLLLRHENRFVIGAEDQAPGLQDLFMGDFICAHDYDGAQKALLAADFDRLFATWLAECGAFEPLPLYLEFQRYIRDGSTCPPFRGVKQSGRGKARTPGAPWHAVLLAFLLGEMHMTLPQAMNTPYGLTNWLYCTRQENEGRLRVVTEDDLSEEDEMRQKLKELGLEPWNQFEEGN
jgi:hypothetical protein